LQNADWGGLGVVLLDKIVGSGDLPRGPHVSLYCQDSGCQDFIQS
jgi:hypothetical protein